MLITLAYAICVDETQLKIGPAKPPAGKTRAERYLLVACTELYTAFLLGDRSLDTFKKFIFADLDGSMIVHDRYKAYDSTELIDLGGRFEHQFCAAHILRDLQGAAETYPDANWPTQIADALRALIHLANTAREQGRDQIPHLAREEHLTWLRRGVAVGLAETLHHGNRPGERKARLLLEFLRDRREEMLRFAVDLNVPPTSNQAERDLRPSKICQNISGRLASEDRAADRYAILGYLSTVAKHGRNKISISRTPCSAAPGCPCCPPQADTASLHTRTRLHTATAACLNDHLLNVCM
ncbi:transposase [Microbispora sp. NBC_01189]|uniref:IS66 family transposase n=1 Tax=Microbispora sp. NBC_01189 TaxID=2903583 RepID=UPI002E0FD91D|nr:transposase [Microbispora sp. NBC_01189]